MSFCVMIKYRSFDFRKTKHHTIKEFNIRQSVIKCKHSTFENYFWWGRNSLGLAQTQGLGPRLRNGSSDLACTVTCFHVGVTFGVSSAVAPNGVYTVQGGVYQADQKPVLYGDSVGQLLKGAITLKPPVIFHITQS